TSLECIPFGAAPQPPEPDLGRQCPPGCNTSLCCKIHASVIFLTCVCALTVLGGRAFSRGSGTNWGWCALSCAVSSCPERQVNGTLAETSKGHKPALMPQPAQRRIQRCSAARLLHLQGFDVLGKVYHALLHLTLVSTTHTPKQRSPHRHLLGSVHGKIGFVADGERDFHREIFPSVVLA